MSSFNSMLLAPAAAVRLSRRRRARGLNGTATEIYRDELSIGPPWLNGALEWPLALEARWLGRGGTLAFGLSLIAILRRHLMLALASLIVSAYRPASATRCPRSSGWSPSACPRRARRR